MNHELMREIAKVFNDIAHQTLDIADQILDAIEASSESTPRSDYEQKLFNVLQETYAALLKNAELWQLPSKEKEK